MIKQIVLIILVSLAFYCVKCQNFDEQLVDLPFFGLLEKKEYLEENLGQLIQKYMRRKKFTKSKFKPSTNILMRF